MPVQRWAWQGNSEIVNGNTACLDVTSHGLVDGSSVETCWGGGGCVLVILISRHISPDACNGGTNQLWTLQSDGTILSQQKTAHPMALTVCDVQASRLNMH